MAQASPGARVLREFTAKQADVKVGDTIKKGEPLVVLEAMKMENILKAIADVTIKKISIEKGNAVEKNQVLIMFE